MQRLEHRLDVALFERSGLIDQPDMAASLVRAALAIGDRARADAVVAATEQLADDHPELAGLAAAAAHVRGLRDRDPVALEQAVATYRDPWAQGSAAEDAGVIRAERREEHGAIIQLTRAQAAYQKAGTRDDLDRVRARLRNLGLRDGPGAAARHATFGWDSLTDTELRVVELVSRGLTNPEVARRMFLSPHTVVFHVRKIFRKLDIDSRVELTRMAVEHAVLGEARPVT